MQFKFVKKAICLLMAASLTFTVLGSTPIYAQTKASLEDQKDDLQDKINAANKVIASLQADKKNAQELVKAINDKVELVQNDINNLQSQISNLEKQIQEIEGKIAELQVQINDINEKIDIKQKEFDKKQDEYNQRLRAMYMSGSVTSLEVLMTSTDMSELLTRMEMVSSISKQDKRILSDLMAAMEDIKNQQKQLNDRKTELKNSKQSIVDSKQQISDNLKEVEAQKAVLDSDRQQRVDVLNKILSEESKQKEIVEDSQDDMEDIDKQINQAANDHQGSIQNGSGSFTHPCPGYSRISATFPRYASGKYHSGIDFSGSAGTSILAADSGTVILVESLGYSYGKHIMIAHGNGLYTHYAHLSAMYVRAGQNVTKGQKIGAMGSTGNSSGTHLHFEVRAGGSSYKNCVNPFNYL